VGNPGDILSLLLLIGGDTVQEGYRSALVFVGEK
jgi:vancomycin resistance protein YoaR